MYIQVYSLNTVFVLPLKLGSDVDHVYNNNNNFYLLKVTIATKCTSISKNF